jgi:hypothetical protein
MNRTGLERDHYWRGNETVAQRVGPSREHLDNFEAHIADGYFSSRYEMQPYLEARLWRSKEESGTIGDKRILT